MTGSEIRGIRVELHMEPAQFAQLLGVHPSTLYRWEAVKDTEVRRMEPMQLQLLTVLDQQIKSRAVQARAELGKAVLTGLLVGGAMLGLYYLLNEAYGDRRQPVDADPGPTTIRGRRTASRKGGRSGA